MRSLIAFICRDFLIQISYRFAFILNLGGTFFSIVLWFYLSRFIGSGEAIRERLGGTDYFSFVITGFLLTGYLNVALFNLSAKLRQEQLMGTLEALLGTPISPTQLVFSMNVWEFLYKSWETIIYLLIAVPFGINFNIGSFVGCFIVFILSLIAFASIGTISASFILIFKKGDPVNLLLSSLSFLFGGVFFPITILPDYLQNISNLLPVTYALKGLRSMALLGGTFVENADSVLFLAVFALILLPLSYICLTIAIKIAKKEGSLVHY